MIRATLKTIAYKRKPTLRTLTTMGHSRSKINEDRMEGVVVRRCDPYVLIPLKVIIERTKKQMN